MIFHAARTATEGHRQALFGYLLDTEDDTAAAADSATLGARIGGACAHDVHYDLTAAWQTDYAAGENHDATMLNTYLATDIEGVRVGAGYSGHSGQDGDDRPFGTLAGIGHKFNGWPDQFLGNNGSGAVSGLQDAYVDVSCTIKGTKLLARYHTFNTAENVTGQFSGGYDRELNLQTKR